MSDYISVSEYAQKHGMDVGRVRLLISQGRISAIKIGKQWAIPAAEPRPDDKRIKSGDYVDWRKPKR